MGAASLEEAVMQAVARSGMTYIVGWGLLLLLWFVVALASPAQSQEDWAQPSGFRFGLYMNGTGIGAENPPANADPDDLYLDEGGGGLSLMLGYSISRRVDVYLNLSSSEHRTTQSHIEAYYTSVIAEAHYQLLPDERVRPYLIGGLGGVGLAVDADELKSETMGGAVGLGVGMLWNLTEHLLLDSSIRIDMIDWNEVKLTRELPSGHEITLANPVDDSGGAGRLQLGLTWAF